MTQTGYANAIINAMLGWLKWLANWVLKLFNLAGGGSPFTWLSRNWLKLLIFFMILGIVLDRVIWLLRWRPYWAWFKKKRIIVNDERMLEGEAFEEIDSKRSDALSGKSYVVKSQTARSTPAQNAQRRSSNAQRPKTAASKPKRNVKNSKKPERKKSFSLLRPQAVRTQQIDDEMYEIGRTDSDYSDYEQNHVFDVSNLPKSSGSGRRNKRKY